MLPLRIWLACAAMSFARVYGGHIPTFAGPYIAFARKFTTCPSDGTLVAHLRTTHFVRARPFELQSIWGNLSLKKAVDDSYLLNVNMALRANNEWKPNAYVVRFPGGACSALRDHLPGMFRLMPTLNPNLHDKKAACVFPQGDFEVTNQTIDWTFPKFKILQYGRYLFTLTSTQGSNSAKRLCLAVDCEIIPKPS